MTASIKKVLPFLVLGSSILISSNALANCTNVQVNGNSQKTELLTKFNKNFANKRENIGVAEVIVKRASSIRFSGCKGYIKLKIKVDKPWPLPDGEGSVVLKGRVTTLNNNKICMKKIQIDSLILSNTSSLEEGTYRSIGNKFIPNGRHCFNLK